MKRLLLLALAVSALMALTAAPVSAGPPGKWTRVTGQGQTAVNTDEIGLERTKDGVLHVAYMREGNGPDAVMHTEISADARRVASPNLVRATQESINNSVDLVGTPGGGLRVLFAGLFPADPDHDEVLATQVSDASGDMWNVPPAAAVSNNSVAGQSAVYAASGIAAASTPGGTFAAAWGDSSPGEGGYHLGLDPNQPDQHFQTSCCAIDPGVGIDSQTEQVMIARNNIAGDTARIQITRVGGGTVTAPGSGASTTQQRISISGRIGAPGVFVAYGRGTNQFLGRPAWWRVGAPKAYFFKSRRGAENVGLAPAPGGRLWIFWEYKGRIEAVRTGKDGVSVGKIRSIRLPKGADDVSGIFGESSRGFLDLLVLTDPPSGLGYFHQRIRPGLRLMANPRKVKRGANVTFTVSDGDPVGGASVRIRFGSKVIDGKSNAAGKVTLHVPGNAAPGGRKAVARKPGYARGVRRIVVLK